MISKNVNQLYTVPTSTKVNYNNTGNMLYITYRDNKPTIDDSKYNTITRMDSDAFGNIWDKDNPSMTVIDDNGNFRTSEIVEYLVTKDGNTIILPEAQKVFEESIGINHDFPTQYKINSESQVINAEISGGLIEYYNQKYNLTNGEEVNQSNEDLKESVDPINNTGQVDVKTEEPEPETKSKLVENVLEGLRDEIEDGLSRIDYSNSELNTFKNGMRVSLNIAPINRYIESSYLTQEEFDNRIGYIFGNSSSFLYKLYSPTKGLVFPYTPTINMHHTVNYENVEILHSNTDFNFYKNTPPPTLQITAEFTADTPENALYMLGAIWFFRALSKTDFGKESKYPGMPPPILYLNGYGKMYDNIPVVITSFDINFDKNKHYIDLKMTNDMFKEYSNLYKNSKFDIKIYNDIRNELLDQWLPTDISMQIGLKILPNMRKVKEKFNLDSYKSGILGHVMGNSKTDDANFNGQGWTW